MGQKQATHIRPRSYFADIGTGRVVSRHVGQSPLSAGADHRHRAMDKNLVHQNICSPGSLNEVFAIPRVAAQNQLAPARFKNKTKCRFNRLVLDLDQADTAAGMLEYYAF